MASRTRLCALLGIAACSTADVPEGTRVVLGLQSSLKIAQLEVHATADALALPLPGGGLWSVAEGTLPFPFEIPLSPLAASAELDVRIQSFDYAFAEPLVSRHFLVEVPASGDWLARVRLERECVPGAQLPGETTAPDCEEPLTCLAATCVDPHLDPSALEAYASDWASDYVDACKPEGSVPTVEIGLGYDTFTPFAPGGDVPLDLGDQGGYHVWLALRVSGLHQSGSITTVHIVSEGGSIDLGEVQWAYALTPADGACELLGLRFITPQEYWTLSGMQELVDLPVRVEAKIVDERGDLALAVAHGFLR